jgi:hypothetical protein
MPTKNPVIGLFKKPFIPKMYYLTFKCSPERSQKIQDGDSLGGSEHREVRFRMGPLAAEYPKKSR